MMRLSFTGLCLAVLLSGFPAVAIPADDPAVDIEYAEQMPLAAHSLLLDSLRFGDRLLAVGERGHIVWSDDEGASWQQADVVPTRSTLTALAAAGNRLWAAGHDTVILTSGDRGRNWTRQYFDPERLQPVLDLHFIDEGHGLAIGAYGLMLVTEDGGVTWQEWAVNDEDDAHLNALVETADGTLLIAGEAGFSYRSRDLGDTWETLELPYEGSMFAALTAADDCVVFAGLRGHVMRSCDAGDSWEEVGSGSEYTLHDGVRHGHGLILVGNGGAILEGEAGQGWRFSTHSSGVDFASVLSLGAGRFLLTGEEGFYIYPEPGAPEGDR